VLYGDTSLTNLTPNGNATATSTAPASVCTATTTRVTALRGKPVAGSPVIQNLAANTSVTVTGRLADGSWVFVQAEWMPGWVQTKTLNISCDLNSLPIINVGGTTASGAAVAPAVMPTIRAFYFSTGISAQPTCNNIPESGLLIQSPNGEKVTFNANGADITI